MGRKNPNLSLTKPTTEDLGGNSTTPSKPSTTPANNAGATPASPSKPSTTPADNAGTTPKTPSATPSSSTTPAVEPADNPSTEINLDALPSLGAVKVSKSFNINSGTIDLLRQTTHLPNGKRRPGTQGLVGDLANNGILREMYRQHLISKKQMEKYLL